MGIVVPCTDSKRSPAPPVRLRACHAEAPGERARNWLAALGSVTATVPANELYKGVGWAASVDLMLVTQELDLEAELMIVSAGHGAVRLADLICNYSATFLPGHPDSVASPTASDPTTDNRAWWRDINSHGDSATPLTELAASVDGLIVAASVVYIDALGDDLAAAIEQTPTVVYCAGTPRHPVVADRAPNFDRRLREGDDPFVRASDQSLNQRVAEAAIRALGLRACEVEAASGLLAKEMERPRPIRHQRRGSTDAELSRFIENRLRANPATGRSRLLRQWRDMGRACEQRRFGRIYDEVRRSGRDSQEIVRVDPR